MSAASRWWSAARGLTGAAMLVALALNAHAQYPTKPILVVAGFTAGGDSDPRGAAI